jgi:DNA-directed RNA polymerase subunit RPC12/RpoP/uncharacterized protein YbaR (Trm112 family)
MWAKLARMMRCHRCRTRFWIDATGHLVSERQSRSVKFACPRCRYQDALPEQLLPTAIACPACQTHLELDANGFVAGGQISPAAGRGKRSGRAPGDQRPRRWLYGAAIAGAAIVVLAVCGVGVRLMQRSVSLLPGSSRSAVEKTPEQFTRLCLQGRVDQAARLVSPDQRVYFRRWLACWQPALGTLDDASAARAEITVQTIHKQPDRAVLYVRVELDSRRSIGLTQQWIPGSDGWLFDAAAAFRAVTGGED